MKKIYNLIIGATLTLGLTSCGTSNPVVGNYPNQYPTRTNDGTIYRAPDGGIFKQGEIYRDRDGKVYENGRMIRTGDILNVPGVLGRNGSVMYPGANPRNLPPGQAKKIYGGDAKDYAPGQMKKRFGGKGKEYSPGNNHRDERNFHENGKHNKGKKGKGKSSNKGKKQYRDMD